MVGFRGLIGGAALALALSACAGTGAVRTASAANECHADRIESEPGRAWWAAQRWRYADDISATAAYTRLLTGQSPWPDWFTPTPSTLPAGTRLQMAIGGGQTPQQPGGFATLDFIRTVDDVREYLAVLRAWKPQVDSVVTYETTQAVPVQVGPIGPQIDPLACRLLWGRWSQVQLLLPSTQRMSVLRIIEVRPIR